MIACGSFEINDMKWNLQTSDILLYNFTSVRLFSKSVFMLQISQILVGHVQSWLSMVYQCFFNFRQGFFW